MSSLAAKASWLWQRACRTRCGRSAVRRSIIAATACRRPPVTSVPDAKVDLTHRHEELCTATAEKRGRPAGLKSIKTPADHRKLHPPDRQNWMPTFAETSMSIDISLETGPLSPWLYAGLAEAGLPAICVDTRHMHAALSARINMTHRNDALGLAQMMRVRLFKPVHVQTPASQQRRLLLTSRKLLQRKPTSRATCATSCVTSA